MAAPIIAGLLRGLIGRSASGAAVQTGGRAAATQAVRNKTVAETAAKRTAPLAPPAAAAKKPDIRTMFRSAPSKGQYPPPPEWFVRPKPDQSVVPPKLSQQPGSQPAPAGKPAQGLFQKITDAISQSQGKMADLLKGTSKPSDTATMTSPSMSGGGKPPIDFGRLMGMMNQTNAHATLSQDVAHEQQQSDLAEQKAQQTAKDNEEQAKSLTGRLSSLGKSTLSGAKSMLSLVGSVTGLSDNLSGFGKLLKGDVIGGLASMAKGTAKMSVIMFTLPFVIKRWTDSLVESRRELVMFNSRIAASIAQLDIQKHHLGVRGAAATETSTLRLNKAIGEFREDFQPLSEDVRTIVNTLALVIVTMGQNTTQIVKAMATIWDPLGLIQKMLDLLEKENEKKGIEGLGFIIKSLKEQGPPPLPQGLKPPIQPLP